MQKTTKKWRVKTSEGPNLYFYPTFLTDEQIGEATCDTTTIKTPDGQEFTLNHDLLLMYCYTISNEEQRQKLLNYYKRMVHYLPYDVSIKLDKEDISSGMVKRRIELPIDQVAMSYAKNEGLKMMLKDSSRFAFKK